MEGKYRFRGCVVHDGQSLNSGHYFSIVRHPCGQLAKPYELTIVNDDKPVMLDCFDYLNELPQNTTPYVIIFEKQ